MSSCLWITNEDDSSQIVGKMTNQQACEKHQGLTVGDAATIEGRSTDQP